LNPSTSSGIIAGISTALVPSSQQGSSLSSDSLTVHVTSGVTTGSRFRSFLDARRNVSSVTDPATTLADRVDPYRALIVKSLRTSARIQASHSVRRLSVPTSQGSTFPFWIAQFSIGGNSATYSQVPATLQRVTAHGYIWIDNTLGLVPATLDGIASDFENAWNSDTTHFGTPDYPANAPGSSYGQTPCDSSGNPVPGATPGPFFVPDVDQHHNLVVVAQNNAGGYGGYFSSINHVYQQVANCFAGQPKSNEASMVVIVWPNSTTVNFELNEDVVRGTGHEFQHLINFVNHCMLAGTPASPNCQFEDSWIDEGMAMLAQDFAVTRLFPSLPYDVYDAQRRGGQYLSSPQSFSLTAFAGIDSGKSTPAFGCSGCYGLAYLFQRYNYDRFGGDTYSHAMEASGQVSVANLEATTNVPFTTLIRDFGIALPAAGTGLSSDPRYNFGPNFKPGTVYTDQFGTQRTLPALTTFAPLSPGSNPTVNAFLGSFFYFAYGPGSCGSSCTGHTAQITDNGSISGFGLNGGIAQH
jgi:hypothetical protein